MDINITYLFQLGLLLTALFALSQILLKPMLKVLVERENLTDSALDEVERLEREGDQARDAYQAKMREARGKAQAELEARRQEARSKERDIVGAARDKATAYVTEARAKLEGQVGEARKSLESDVQNLADQFVAKVVGR